MNQSQHEPVRLAIVGCGAITDIAHLPAALRSNAVQVYALIDKKLDNAKALARKYGLSDILILTDLQQVLEKVDGVLIAAPNGAHFELAKAALDAGRPVLVEKPLTIAFGDANTLCELAQARQTFISVGYVTRHFPSVRLMKQLLESGDLGRVLSFHIEYGTSKDGWEPLSGYTVDQRMSGGGALIGTGTHFIDRTLYWFGNPKSFTYEDDSYGGVEANCKGELSFDNGGSPFSGTFFLSKTIALQNKMFVETERYTCIFDQSQPGIIKAFPKDKPELVFDIRPAFLKQDSAQLSYFQVQLEEFASIIRKGGRPTVDGLFGAESVKLVEQMYANRSQLEESWLLSGRKEATAGT